MKCDVPLLYLAGRKDYLIRKHNIAWIRKIKRHVIVTELDTQHFTLQLEPERSADEIEKFIQSTGQPSESPYLK